jgi:hypothetical protein
VNPESIAGDMHLDADENWHVGGDVDIYSVALHEAGHALGLGHSDKPGDVMYPYYRSNMTLSANDIGAVQTLYGLPGTAPAPIAAPAPPPTTPAPPALPSPLRLTLDSIPAATSSNQLTATGTLSGGLAPFSVQWQTDHGYSGAAALVASGSAAAVSWTASGIALVNGSNTISVTAYDSSRQTATQTARVTLSQPPPPSSGLPVTVAITSPASSVQSVSTATVSLAGSASGGSGIARVTWQTSGGASGTATGTSHWTVSGVPALVGTNTIIVRAWDTKGSSAWSAVVLVRH